MQTATCCHRQQAPALIGINEQDEWLFCTRTSRQITSAEVPGPSHPLHITPFSRPLWVARLKTSKRLTVSWLRGVPGKHTHTVETDFGVYWANDNITSMSVLLYCRAEMYAGRVTCCPLVNHAECAPRALLRLEKKMAQKDGRRDGRQTVRIRSPLDAASAIAEESYTWAISFCFLLFILSPAFFFIFIAAFLASFHLRTYLNTIDRRAVSLRRLSFLSHSANDQWRF